MINVSVRMGLLGEKVQHLPPTSVDRLKSPRFLYNQFREHLPPDTKVQVAIDGVLLEPEQIDEPFQDGQQIVLIPQTGYTYLAAAAYYIVEIIISIIVAAAVSYIAYLLAPRPKAPGLPQERGDDASQSYAWSGPKTNYGPGLIIPWGYGEHDLAGQGIWIEAEASRDTLGTTTLDDRLRLILSLCEGPIYRIGGKAVNVNGVGGSPGETSGGNFLSDCRVNGNLISATALPGARAWTRLGTQDQPALPPPLAGISRTFSPLATLNEAQDGHILTIDEEGEITEVAIVLYAPSGLFRTLPTGGTTGINPAFFVSVRVPNGPIILSWITGIGHPTQALQGPVGVTDSRVLPAPHTGPLEIEVRRSSPSGAPDAISLVQWRDCVVKSPTTLSYPLDALLGLELKAGAQFSGARPNITIKCALSKVRMWTEEDGWSDPLWDVPGTGVYSFHNHAPGRNPAWCLLDFLLARWGLGKWISEDRIDLPAFLRWAVHCDIDPNPLSPWGEPSHTVDVVGDRVRPAWEWVLLFCSAGRAAPILKNGKISIVYQYRDAHSQGPVSVPAKAPLQLLTGAMVENLQVNWLAKSDKPSTYLYQYVDESRGYAQRVLPVPDPESSVDDPTAFTRDKYRPETIQAFGIVRRSQLWREGRWRHRINRRVDHEVGFTAGPHIMALEVGDVFELQHPILKRTSTDQPLAGQVRGGGLATTSAIIDHHLTGTGLQIVWRKKDQTIGRANVEDSYVNTTDAETGLPICAITFASNQDIEIGCMCSVAKIDQVTFEYEMVGANRREDLKRDIRAILWTPDAYDPETETAYLDGVDDVDAPVEDQPIDRPDDNGLPASVKGIGIQQRVEGDYVIRWAMPAHLSGTQARVYARAEDLPGAWFLLGDSESSEVIVDGLQVGVPIVVSVCLKTREGFPVPPDLGDQVTVTPSEFPERSLPSVTNARSTLVESGLLLQWDDQGLIDLKLYEVRAGSNWALGEVLYRGRAPRVILASPRAGVVLMVASQSVSGLYSQPVELDAVDWSPQGSSSFLNVDDISTAPAGTLVNVTYAEGDQEMTIADGEFEGSYTSLEQVMTKQGPYFWQVRYDVTESESTLVEDLTFAVGSGDARWRTSSGRAASPAQPGLDWQTQVSDLSQLVGDLPDSFLVGGDLGEVGSHTRVLVESRFYVDGAWGEYREHIDRVVVAQRMQVRLTFGRRSLEYQATCRLLTYRAFL